MGIIQRRQYKSGTRYRAIIRRTGEKTVSKTFKKKANAQLWMKKTESELERGEFCNDDQNFGNIIRRYIVEVGRIKTIGRSKMYTLDMLRKELGHYKLKDITFNVLYDFASRRQCGPATLKSDMIYIGVVYNTAESLWNVTPNIKDYRRCMETLSRLDLISSSSERDRRVTDNELTEILNNASSTLPVSDIAWFAIHTSMRLGEICSLRWSDLREDGRSIIIRSRKHPRKKRDQLVPLLPEAQKIIKRQSVSKSDEYVPIGSARHRERVFAGELIFPYQSRSVSSAFRKGREKSRIDDLRFHDLRHEAISRLFELGFDSMVVAVFSGHRDINMLRRYTHINANKILKMLDCSELNLDVAA